MLLSLWTKTAGIPLQMLPGCSQDVLGSRRHRGPESTTVISASLLFLKRQSRPAAQGIPPPADPGPGSLASSLLCSAFLGHASGEGQREVEGCQHSSRQRSERSVLRASARGRAQGEAQGPQRDIVQGAAEWLPHPRPL